MEIRIAQPHESADFARLVLFSGPRLLPALFGPRVEDLLRFLFTRPNNLFSFEHVRFALANERIIGVALAMDAHTYNREGPGTAAGMLRFLKGGFLPLFFRLLRIYRMSHTITTGQYYLSCLAVAPEFRGKGIGKNLLDVFEHEGRALGMGETALDVEVDNRNARRFYLREGYEFRKEGPSVLLGGQRFQFIRMVKKVHGLSRS
ncbi:MAG TPA: GNAT family N-acetyltransferase [Atribacteraceae bacterium]|nr:GNAT family N-acetyltransferase [Atribacteraceae bacterium]